MNNESEQVFLVNTSDNQTSIFPQKSAEGPETQVNLENVQDFSNVCRICATITEFVLPIFNGEGVENSLADKIHQHLPIKVTQQDVLPRVLCYQCANTLLAWHELVQCCVQANAALCTRALTIQKQEPAEKNAALELKLDADNKCDDLAELFECTVEPPEYVEPLSAARSATALSPTTLSLSISPYSMHSMTTPSSAPRPLATSLVTTSPQLVTSVAPTPRSVRSWTNLTRSVRSRTTIAPAMPTNTTPTSSVFLATSATDSPSIVSLQESQSIISGVVATSPNVCFTNTITSSYTTSAAGSSAATETMTSRTTASITVSSNISQKTTVSSIQTTPTPSRKVSSTVTRATPTEKNLRNTSLRTSKNILHPPPSPTLPSPKIVDTERNKFCKYCDTEHAPSEFNSHLLSAHSEFLFQCDECDSFVDKKDLIIHMSMHMMYTTAKQKKLEKEKERELEKEQIKIESVEKDNSALKRKNEWTESVWKADSSASVSQNNNNQNKNKLNEFSDHSDAEYDFGPLPESVFEAIEDSQDFESIIDMKYNSIVPEVNKTAKKTNEDSLSCTINMENIEKVSNKRKKNFRRRAKRTKYSYLQIPDSNITDISETDSGLVGVSSAHNTVEIHNENENQPETKRLSPAASDDPFVPSTTLKKRADESPKKPKSRKTKWVCAKCDKVYTVSSSYFYHMKYFHNKAKEHKCDVCGKSFGTRAILNDHSKTHSETYELECEECGKKFKTKASLYIHQQSHTGLKKYTCDECQKSFRWRTHMERHWHRHMAHKAFACGVCGRGFAINADRLRHEQTHTAGRHTCPQCGVTLAQLRYLKKHMKIHEDEAKFKKTPAKHKKLVKKRP